MFLVANKYSNSSTDSQISTQDGTGKHRSFYNNNNNNNNNNIQQLTLKFGLLRNILLFVSSQSFIFLRLYTRELYDVSCRYSVAKKRVPFFFRMGVRRGPQTYKKPSGFFYLAVSNRATAWNLWRAMVCWRDPPLLSQGGAADSQAPKELKLGALRAHTSTPQSFPRAGDPRGLRLAEKKLIDNKNKKLCT
eukprot:gene11789-8100_t